MRPFSVKALEKRQQSIKLKKKHNDHDSNVLNAACKLALSKGDSMEMKNDAHNYEQL
jgi:hypothetical protein